MQRRLFLTASAAVFLIILVGFGCTKLDTTTLGSDLVTVDNVNTFADTLNINSTQGYFNDSTILQKADNHAIGFISNDPLFGKTDARVYVQFKPTFYPFYFGTAGDTVKNNSYAGGSVNAGLDSAFLCLSYKGAWGDTSSIGNIAQTFQVKAITDDNFRAKTDTIRQLGSTPPTVLPASPVLGSAIITPQIIASKVMLGRGANRDSVTNQIRIKFTGAGADFASTLFNEQDTSMLSSNNGFRNDSSFRSKYNGFEIKVTNGMGNTLYFVNLSEVKSRLEFHFHKTKNGIKDTVVQSFQMYTSQTGASAASSSMNYIKRDYSTGTIPSANVPTNNIYLQTAPGTFSNLSIPGLTGYSNRIVHRAVLIVEQTPGDPATDKIYTPPPFLYLDLKDTVVSTTQQYKPVYFDLTSQVPYDPDAKTLNALYHPFPAANVDIANFGGAAVQKFEPGGTAFYRYEINLTRYIQHIVTNGYKNYDLRLFAPFNYYYPQYLGTKYLIPYYNPIAFGRVRVGAGSTQNVPHKMKLVVIYSKV